MDANPEMIEKSANFSEVISDNINPMLKARLEVARYRLEVDIAYELSKIGMFAPSAYDIKRIIDGLPEDVLCQELAKRT
jgi:hypothetical protein